MAFCIWCCVEAYSRVSMAMFFEMFVWFLKACSAFRVAKYRCWCVAIRFALKNWIQMFWGLVLRLFWRYCVVCWGFVFLNPVISV